jgi:hypothetical protein
VPLVARQLSEATPRIILSAMDSKKFMRMWLGVVLLVSGWGAATGQVRAQDARAALREPPVPELNENQMRFLTQVAQRTLRDKALGRGTYTPRYVPSALEEMQVEAVVRLRAGGFLRNAGAGGPGSASLAVRDAALAAWQDLEQSLPEDRRPLDVINGLVTEIEIVGPPMELHLDGDWTLPRVVDPFIETGVHGVVLNAGAGAVRVCPTEFFTSDKVLADALKSMAQQVTKASPTLGQVQLYRFRTVHWYAPPMSEEVVPLHRGLTVLPRDAVTRKNLDESIEKLIDYMQYRQLPNGLFSYQYEPGAHRYSEENNLVRQIGAAASLAYAARVTGDDKLAADALRAIEYHLQGLTQVPGKAEAAYIATADQKNKLGVTALLAVALAEHPEAERFARVRRQMVNGMLELQHPSGMFITAFPPARELGAQDYFPGEALLALSEDYAHEPTAEVRDAFDRAINFYRDYFKKHPSPAFVPWQVQAYAQMVHFTKRKDYTEYVFELTDWLAADQITPANNPWPEMWGGIASYQEGRAGVATAAYLEGFADALILARQVGDEERVRRYEEVVRLAARFVMQLQFREEEAYFVPFPADVVGGIRTSPSLGFLRIDHSQHALIGLLKARQALYPE